MDYFLLRRLFPDPHLSNALDLHEAKGHGRHVHPFLTELVYYFFATIQILQTFLRGV